MRGLIAAIGSIAGVGLGFSITLPLLALTLEDRGISSTWIGINTAFWGLSSLAVTPFVVAPSVANARTAASMVFASFAQLAVQQLCDSSRSRITRRESSGESRLIFARAAA